MLASRKRILIHNLRLELERGQLFVAAFHNAGIKSSETMYRWMRNSDRLKKFLMSCQDRGQKKRDTAVEDAFFKKLKDGKATGTEYEFYLCNRIPERWKKLKENAVVVQTEVNVETVQGGNSNTFSGEDAELVSSIRAKLLPEIPAQ